MDRPPEENLLHPLAKLAEWKEHSKMPVGMRDAQAVVLRDKVYLGGGDGPEGPSSKLLIYDFSNDSWDMLDTPTQQYSLAVYRSKLVLVGGVDPFHNVVSKSWWSLDEKHRWTERFPSMPMERFGASVVSDGNYLIVAGGDKGGVFGRLDVVDVYDGLEWRRVQSLPRTCSRMKSVVHEGFWYLVGGVGQDHKVFYTSLESLIASTHSAAVGDDPVWKTLPDAPFQYSTPVIFGKQLTTVGGLYTSAIYLYHPIKRWVRVGDLPVAFSFVCSLVLPTTGELVMVGGKSRREISSHVFRTKIQVTPYPDGNLTISALDRLEAVGNISFFNRLNPKLSVMSSTLNLDKSDWVNSRFMFEEWLSSHKSSLPPTWDTLVGVLLNIYSPLAMEIMDFFNKTTPGNIPSLAASLELQPKLKEDSTQSLSTGNKEEQTKPDYKEEHIQACPDCQDKGTQVTPDSQEVDTGANPDYQEIAVQTSPEPVVEEYMQVLEEELEQCHDDRRAALERIRSLTEENEELRKQLHLRHPDDTLTDIETTGFLRGMDIVGVTSFLITNQAQTFHWAGYGLKLHIPQGSLPTGLEECRLYIKVGLSGEFEFPKDTSLVSAVYWIDSKPRRRFSKPIRMELQHCSKSNQSSKLSIVHAKCSQETLPYTFTPLEEGEFKLSSYGSIRLSHFSLIAVTANEPQYCAGLYYIGRGCTVCKVCFVITKNLEAYKTVIQNHLSSATIGAECMIEFEGDRISLDIRSKDMGKKEWSITPLSAPVVMKDHVDSFTPGKLLPYCQLRIQWNGKRKPVALCHQVTLMGAKKPYDFITIESDPLQISTMEQDLPKMESEPKLQDLMNKVAAKIPSKWRDVGIQLGLDQNVLNAVAQVSPGDTNHCFSNVFTLWRNRKTCPYTWSTIVQALQTAAVGQKKLAEDICSELH